MTKADLKTGMIVENRMGAKAMVLLGTEKGDMITGETWMPLFALEDNLTCPNINYADIVKVYQPKSNLEFAQKYWDRAELIWERKEFTYPMWFRSIEGLIVKFDGLTSGVVVKEKHPGNCFYLSVGDYYDDFIKHTNSKVWTQIEEPIEELTVAEIEQKLGYKIKIVK